MWALRDKIDILRKTNPFLPPGNKESTSWEIIYADLLARYVRLSRLGSNEQLLPWTISCYIRRSMENNGQFAGTDHFLSVWYRR